MAVGKSCSNGEVLFIKIRKRFKNRFLKQNFRKMNILQIIDSLDTNKIKN